MLDWTTLNRSETLAPLLIELYDSHKIYSLAKDKSPEARLKLSEQVSTLLSNQLSPREEDLVCDILLTLIRQAETDLKIALAEKLSSLESVPSPVLLQLAYDEISVSEIVLKNSMCLETLDLMYIIQSHEAPYWRAIAQRKALPDTVIDVLSEVEDEETHVKLAANKSIMLTEHAAQRLSEHAVESEEIRAVLIEREDLCQELAEKLHQAVGDAMRDFVVNSHDTTSNDLAVLDPAIESVIETTPRKTEDIDFSLLIPRELTLFQARKLGEQGILSAHTMIESLRLKNYKFFVAQFATLAGLYPDQAIEILKQTYGHGLAVICKAHNIEKSDFINMFLMTEIFRSQEKATKAKVLHRAISYYERLTTESARKLLS